MSAANRFGPGAFDFRDLSMKRSSKPDYFSLKSVRGSSPTASLAADLSQNFHIDMRYALSHARFGIVTNADQPATTYSTPIALYFKSFRDH
jgi:M-phase inducer tyrosine phosphatase